VLPNVFLLQALHFFVSWMFWRILRASWLKTCLVNTPQRNLTLFIQQLKQCVFAFLAYHRYVLQVVDKLARGGAAGQVAWHLVAETVDLDVGVTLDLTVDALEPFTPPAAHEVAPDRSGDEDYGVAWRRMARDSLDRCSDVEVPAV
jgi:hypothetical protein